MDPAELVSHVRAALRRLVCFVAGHRTVRTITGIEWRDFSVFGAVGTITGSRYDCARCGREGVRGGR